MVYSFYILFYIIVKNTTQIQFKIIKKIRTFNMLEHKFELTFHFSILKMEMKEKKYKTRESIILCSIKDYFFFFEQR